MTRTNAWIALAAAALALGPALAPRAGAQGAIEAPFVEEEPAPTGPADPRWQEAPAAQVTLTPQMIIPPVGGGSVTQLEVRALHDGERIAFRLAWADPTADREVGVATFRDAAAVGFPVGESDQPPSPFMGDAGNPVVIWQWTADLEANQRGRGGFADRYPQTDGVWYFPQDQMVSRRVRGWRGTEAVMEFVARGYGTLERRPSRSVAARSRREEAAWSVVLHRRLNTGNPADPDFRPGETAHAIFAVWNGSADEVNGRKAVTLAWTPLHLESTLDEVAGGGAEGGDGGE